MGYRPKPILVRLNPHMKAKSTIAGALAKWLPLAVLATVCGAEVPTVPISKDKVLGWWHGGDTNDLNCILVFEPDQAKVLTFRGKQHVSTLTDRYTVHP